VISNAPIIHLNGAPGVGKLTIARVLAARLQARLLDNHAIHDVAFGLTEFQTTEFYETVRAVRAVAYDRIIRLPRSMSVVLTDAFFADSAWGRESWDEVLGLAERRKAPLLAVCLSCDPDEHRRRIASADRAAKGKVQDPEYVNRCIGRKLTQLADPQSLSLDVTQVSPDEAAFHIATWANRWPGAELGTRLAVSTGA
jgi:predicted kinase